MNTNIRKGTIEDIVRVAEIVVFNNRINYYPIFKDIEYSFKEYNVKDVAKDFLDDHDFMDGLYVYDDLVVKGFVSVSNGRINKLFVDHFFQNLGIGKELLTFATNNLNGNHLWALEKNTRALRFYKRYGFVPDGKKEFEEGTSEFLIHLVKK